MKERLKGLWQVIVGIGGLLIVALFVMAFLGAFDDEAEEIGNAEIFRGNDTKSVFSGDTELAVTKDGEVASENRSGGEQTKLVSESGADAGGNKYLQTGYSYELKNGNEFAITDIGIIYEFSNRSTIGYVAVEYTNNSSSTEYLGSEDISAFIDDFQESVNISVPISIDNVVYNGEPFAIDSGRKGRYIYFTLFPSSGETAEKVELSLYGGSILFKEDGQWLYADESADEIKAETQEYLDSVKAEKEWMESHEALPLNVICPDEMYGAYIDKNIGMIGDVELIEAIPGKYTTTTSNSNTVATVNEDGTLTLENGTFEFDSLALWQDLSGAYSIDAEAGYKVGFFGNGYIYIWTPDKVDPDNYDEGFYKKIG